MFTDLQANLISAFLECALFGIFFVASTASLILLLKRHSRNNRVSEVVTISTSVFRWKKWAAAAWSLRRSPLILATVLFMGTICAVRLSYFFFAGLLPTTDIGAFVASTASSQSIASSEGSSTTLLVTR